MSDDETWPAYLEVALRAPVLNGGVFGYGFDQSVMRAESLVPVFHPDVVVVSVLADDVLRCAFKRRTNTEKPYFDVSGDALILRNTPVPEPDRVHPEVGTLGQIASAGFFIHLLARRALPKEWIEASNGLLRTESTGADSSRIACLLMGRLRRLALASGTRVLVLAQYLEESSPADLATMNAALECARQSQLEIADSYAPLIELEKNDAQAYERLFRGHMTPEGNRFIADVLARVIEPPGSTGE